MASADPASREGGGGKPMLARQRAKEDAAAGKTVQSNGFFPLGYRDGFAQWWAGLTTAETEHRVLSFIPYLKSPPTHTQTGTSPVDAPGNHGEVDKDKSKEAAPVRTESNSDPYGPRQWRSELVQLAGKGKYLNEFSVERIAEGEPAKNSLVMLHGYGAGLGFFYKNFEALSRLPSWKLYALDLLGMGRSSRPNFRIHSKDKTEKVREAENWFIDALEEWRIKRGIDKMTLLGHSLGGYLAVCYALKYPGHLNKLILASPVGIPEDPYATSENAPDPDDGTVVNEFTQAPGEEPASDSADASSSAPNAGAARKIGKPPPRRLPRWAVALWDANISPFSFVRLSGPLGPRLASGWTSRRFSHLPADQAEALHNYSYSMFRQRGSGEYALGYILAPGAYARSPLVHRVQGVGRQLLKEHSQPEPDAASTVTESQAKQLRENGIPVVFMYGQNDWMDVNGGRDCEAILEAQKTAALRNASPRERELENGSATVRVVRDAGHHLYLEGHEEFNEMMLEELRDVEKRQARLAGLQ